MATVTFGCGSSHSPLLTVPGGLWPQWSEFRDHRGELLDQQGVATTFEELAQRAPERLGEQLRREILYERYAACQRWIARISSSIVHADIDALVVVGDDQYGEVFERSNVPAIYIYCGDEVLNKGLELRPELPEAAQMGLGGAAGPADRRYPTAGPLARHLVGELVRQGFDIARGDELPPGKGIGHAFGFVINRLLPHRDLPLVPVLVNCYFAPNQPTPERCWQLGRALAGAVSSFEEDARVGIMASGGLSHFVVDEEIDRQVLALLDEGRPEDLVKLPQHRLNSGTSEIRNWIVAAAALGDTPVTWSQYVPCYRSEAGTGLGAAFALWGSPRERRAQPGAAHRPSYTE